MEFKSKSGFRIWFWFKEFFSLDASSEESDSFSRIDLKSDSDELEFVTESDFRAAVKLSLEFFWSFFNNIYKR